MRVLSVGSLPPAKGGGVYGGVATFHASLLDGLNEFEAEVELVGVVPTAPFDRELDIPVFTRPADATIAGFYEDLLERLRPDVVLMNHFAHTIGVTHTRLRPSAAAVGIAHSWHSVTQRSGEERAHAAAVTEEAIEGLEALVAVSSHCFREGRELGFAYPAIAESIHPPLQPFYREDAGVLDRPRNGVAFLGSLVPRKNPLALAKAAVGLSRLEVCFAGHGELEDSLRALIERLSLADRVRIARLTDPEARDLLLRSRAMCLPSTSETFGLAYIEALACGTPVIGFGPTVREIRDEMGIEIGEPLESGAPEEIGAAIERVLATEWDRKLLRRATLASFDLRRVTERHVDLLERVVAAPAGGRG
jgi:glycosyltransferase involved in cell wall biosynthesis